MSKPKIRRLDKIKGVELAPGGTDRDDLVLMLKDALSVAARLAASAGGGIAGSAVSAAIGAAAELLSMVSAKCSLASPAREIDTTLSSSGDIVLRCRHSPVHEWDLSGKRLK